MVMVEHRVADVLPLVDRVIAIEAGGGVVADGPAQAVFAREGEHLKRLGVWVPGAAPAAPPRQAAAGGEAIVARDLSYLYPRGEGPALDGVSAAVRRGSALAITGPNGSGKSTLAMLLAGLLRPRRGEVRAFGDEPWRLRPRTLVRRIGTVFQDPEHQLVASRIDDELRVGPRAIGLRADEAERRVHGLLEPLTPDPHAPLARVHPLAKIAAALVLMFTLFLTLDPLTPALVLVAEVAAVPLIGIAPRALLRRAFPVFIAAIGIGFFNTLLSGNVAGGIAIGIRLVGIALAGIVAVASIDPTELADALTEHLHAPARFTIGALAAFRLMPLFADEWDTIALARRARGLDDARGP